jgi:hypothetical protein
MLLSGVPQRHRNRLSTDLQLRWPRSFACVKGILETSPLTQNLQSCRVVPAGMERYTGHVLVEETMLRKVTPFKFFSAYSKKWGGSWTIYRGRARRSLQMASTLFAGRCLTRQDRDSGAALNADAWLCGQPAIPAESSTSDLAGP